MTRRYTTQEVAERYSVTSRTVQRWCRAGDITHLRTRSGTIRFTDEHLEEFEQAYTCRPVVSVDVNQPNPDYAPTNPVVVPMRRRAG